MPHRFSPLTHSKYVERTLPAIEFIKLLMLHIPKKHFKMIRYYGIYVRHRKIDKNPMDLLDMDMIDDLRSLRFISNNENVIFLGTPNVGKTHLTIALRISVIENKYSAYFISCHHLIQNLLKANHENRPDERLKQYAKYKILIIDEISYLPTSLEGAISCFWRLYYFSFDSKTTVSTCI